MSKISKTAKASAVSTVGEKKVISDADYIKNLRYDVNNGIHATQEGARALLRAYDKAIDELSKSDVEHYKTQEQVKTLETALQAALEENEKQKAEIVKLNGEIAAAQAIFGGTSNA